MKYNTNEIKILSYNIFWKAMTVDRSFDLPQCKIINNNNMIYTHCAQNIANFIDSHDLFDFVCLQEAANWQTLALLSKNLAQLTPIMHKPGLERIVTFYDETKYTLDPDCHTIEHWMVDVNRPLLINFFNGHLCLINLHAGHHGDIYHLDKYIMRALGNIKNTSNIKNTINNSNGDINKYLHKLNTYDIIIAGDFNSELSNKDNFAFFFNNFFHSPRHFYGLNKIPTCCSNKLTANFVTRISDHILTTFGKIYNEVFMVKNASDHMPVISCINQYVGQDINQYVGQNIKKQLRIGYDFDGVLHTYVGLPDKSGQRHCLTDNDISPKYQFHPIINQIKYQIDNGYEISIITARNRDSFEIINNFLINSILSNDVSKIKIYFTADMDKTNILSKLKINDFYDDSCLRINEVYNSIIANRLPNLTNLYFVEPENMTWTKITNNNINQLCQQQKIQKIQKILTKLNSVIDTAVANNDYTQKTSMRIKNLEEKIKSLMFMLS